MPAQLSYPGVYIEEVSSGVRTIVGVATSIGAFVGRAPRGPVNQAVTVTSFGEFDRLFGGLWKESRLGFAVRDFFLNGGSTAVIVRIFHTTTGKSAKTKIKRTDLVLEAVQEGAWGNSLRVRVDYETRDPDPLLSESSTSLFNLTVRDGSTGAIEMHRNVVVAPADHPRLLSRVLENDSTLVHVNTLGAARPDDHAAKPQPGKTIWDDQGPTPADQTSTGLDTSVAADVANDGDVLVEADFDDPALEDPKLGLYALEKADLFNLLVIPPYTSADAVDVGLVTNAVKYCERRRAVYIADVPPTWNTVAEVTTGFASGFDTTVGAISANAALFFPRLRQPNPLRDGQVETFGVGGAVAGVIARTDTQRGVWKAPAGLDASLEGVPALETALTDGDIGQLNPLGVNCLRAMPAAGRVVWGSRTLKGADRLTSEWKYLPVRRTALFIEESLFRGTQWVVFEPNDEPLWAQIRLNVGAFMNNLFRQGAFQGTTPRDAYFVRCDRETTTQADIDLGIVNIHVGFAPLKPAEFVVIRLQQIAGASAA